MTVSRGLTANLGNFNSFRAEVGLTADLDVGENPNEAFTALNEQTQGYLKEAMRDVRGITYEPKK